MANPNLTQAEDDKKSQNLLSAFKDYSGKKPRRGVGFNIAISPLAMAHIGHIAMQWSALMYQVDFQIKFKRNFPGVPNELRGNARWEAKQQIAHLRKVGKMVYAQERETAVREFDDILDQALELKLIRDALVHGTYGAAENKDPDVVTVYYKGGKQSFTTVRLDEVARAIGEINVALMDFDSWVWYERNVALLEKLLSQTPE